MVLHGVTQATTDAEQISYWWRSRPDANIGLACGTVIVIDIDTSRSLSDLFSNFQNSEAHVPLSHIKRNSLLAATDADACRPRCAGLGAC
jgi:hypothetical protein